MKLRKKLTPLLLAAALLASLAVPVRAAARFSDVPAAFWCAPAIEQMAEGGLIRGYSDGTFRPGDTMSVGAFITVVARCAGTDYGADGNGYWCGGTVRGARAAGWLPESYCSAAVSAGTYAKPITRETAVYVLMKGLQPQDRGLGYTAGQIPDYDRIGADVRETVLAAYNAGITKGGASGAFGPGDLLNRAQAAELLRRAGFVRAAQLPSGCEVDYLDVGQADAILIRCGGRSMLIDGGNTEDSSRIVSYLKKSGITYLSAVVCTHAHEDHAGGLAGALNQAAAGTVYAPVTSYDSDAFRSFAKYTAQQGLPITVPEAGTEFTLGGATLRFLGPLRSDYGEVNDSSIVLRMTYGGTSFLFTGDAGEESEKDLLSSGQTLSSTVLKVGHHGSATATSYAFLRAVSPQYAVISVGAGNSYGHPDAAVLSRLRDADAALYRTDLQGTITCVSDGKTVTVTPEKNPNAITNPTAADGSGQNSAELRYIGNINSHKFHRPDCPSLPEEQNRITFADRAAAVAAGYQPCKICNP
ncbi:MAG: MBL fold metallo-hydrolase [Oscillibacter sp.]|jgi:competence protein ComEC|nr:MBL fold metallo-hydrolase [Oscillibacter sp.]